MNEYVEKYLEQLQSILPSIEFKPHVQKKYTGYKYKYSPRGSSHHWLSFGIIHEPQLEYWFNIGAVKQLDDFAPIKEILLEINESKEAFKILEKKGQYFIKAGVLFNNADNEELEKGLNQILDAAKYALNELNGSGFLGIEKTDETEPAKSIEESTIKCSACQSELEADDKFCSNCGEKVELASAPAIEAPNEEQEVFKNRMDELWEAENWEELVKCFEEKFNWEDLDLKDSDLLIPIQYYLRGLYRIDDREIDALNRSKEVLVKQGCFDEVNEEDDFFLDIMQTAHLARLKLNAKTLFTYAYAAKYLKNIDEIESAIKLLEEYNPEEEYIKKLKDKLEELTAPKVPQRYYLKINFVCKTKKETKEFIRDYKKGTLIRGYFYYLSEGENLSKSAAKNILFSELIYWDNAIDHYFGNYILHPDVNGWEDVTNPVIGEIEVLGKENEFEKPKNGPGTSEW